MIHILIGTRAQLIKMVPVMHELKKRCIAYNFIFLAQHQKTIYEILEQFHLKKPDYVIGDRNRDIVKTVEMIRWTLRVIIHGYFYRKTIFRNDSKGIVLVHGDAPPLFIGALLAKFQGIKVAAVEAGLRSYNFFKPFPEEFIRVGASCLGLIDVYFCQDTKAWKNVQRYKKKSYITGGNTIYDTLVLSRQIVGNEKPDTVVENEKPFGIVTLHRYETITNIATMKEVVHLLANICETVALKFILHPPTEKALEKFKLLADMKEIANLVLLPRMDFISFNRLMLQAEFIISDGGSNQEESAYLGIPCLLLRKETERFEGIGKNVVLSRFDKKIINKFISSYKNYSIKTAVKNRSPAVMIIDTVMDYR